MVGAHGRGTYDQHESLRLRRGVLQFTLPTSREHITLTHSHSRTYTPKDIIRTQKNIFWEKKNDMKFPRISNLDAMGIRGVPNNVREIVDFQSRGGTGWSPAVTGAMK